MQVLRRQSAPLPTPSPGRESLNARLAARETAGKTLVRLQETVNASWERLIAADRAVDAAREALEHAGRNAGDAEAVLNGTAPAASSLIAAARETLAAAEADAAAIRAARRTIEERISSLESGRAMDDLMVKSAALAVLKADHGAEIGALLDEVEKLQAQLMSKSKALEWMFRMNVFPPNGDPNEMERRADTLRGRFQSPPMWWNALTAIPSEDEARWDTRLTALLNGVEIE
jgi:hypothetical protein